MDFGIPLGFPIQTTTKLKLGRNKFPSNNDAHILRQPPKAPTPPHSSPPNPTRFPPSPPTLQPPLHHPHSRHLPPHPQNSQPPPPPPPPVFCPRRRTTPPTPRAPLRRWRPRRPKTPAAASAPPGGRSRCPAPATRRKKQRRSANMDLFHKNWSPLFKVGHPIFGFWRNL